MKNRVDTWARPIQRRPLPETIAKIGLKVKDRRAETAVQARTDGDGGGACEIRVFLRHDEIF